MVKFFFMEDHSEILPKPPMNAFLSLWRGMEAVNAFPYLLAVPILLDLLLWFGPHISIFRLVGMDPVWPKLLGESATAMEQWTEGLQRLNLGALLATWPFYPPSLMAAVQPLQTPMGDPFVLEVTSYPELILWVFLIIGFSIPLGGMYWIMAGKAAGPAMDTGWNPWKALIRVMGIAAVQAIVFIALLLFVGMPVYIALAVVSSFFGIANAVLICASSVGLCGLIWVYLIFLFAYHGTVLYLDDLPKALLRSLEMMRIQSAYSLIAITIYFLLYSISMNIWMLSSETDWTALLAILGHAYIVSVVVTASLKFYGDKRRWIDEMRRYQMAHLGSTPTLMNR